MPEQRSHNQYLLQEQNFRTRTVPSKFQELVVSMVLFPSFILFLVSLFFYSLLAFPRLSEGADKHQGSIGKVKIPNIVELTGEQKLAKMQKQVKGPQAPAPVADEAPTPKPAAPEV